jgi:hypothetical protein
MLRAVESVAEKKGDCLSVGSLNEEGVTPHNGAG